MLWKSRWWEKEEKYFSCHITELLFYFLPLAENCDESLRFASLSTFFACVGEWAILYVQNFSFFRFFVKKVIMKTAFIPLAMIIKFVSLHFISASGASLPAQDPHSSYLPSHGGSRG